MVRGGTPNLTPKHKAHVLTSAYVEACVSYTGRHKTTSVLCPHCCTGRHKTASVFCPHCMGTSVPHTH